jgi:uncharacterized protein YebE (UPF0316 family)
VFTFSDLVAEQAAWLPVLIFMARVADVSLGTVRTVFVVRGMREFAAGIGFLEVTIWLLAISTVVQRLDAPLNVIAYAGGYATGNYVGVWLETKLALGHQLVQLVSADDSQDLRRRLEEAGHRVTAVPAHSGQDAVTLLLVTVPRRQVASVMALAREADPTVVLTTEDLRFFHPGLCPAPARPTGWRAVLKMK